MGLLSLGTPLKWEDAKKHADHVRENGIKQFINAYSQLKDIVFGELLWGDEIEYMIVSFDDNKKEAPLSLSAEAILDKLHSTEVQSNFSWHPEYANYMLEGVPAKPYGPGLDSLLLIEPNMLKRRQEAQSALSENERLMTLTAYPRLGCEKSLKPWDPTIGDAAKSIFLPDSVTFPHARFPTLTKNIRMRRGSKVAINVPVFNDKKTIDPHTLLPSNLAPELTEGAKPGHVYMDCMCFGMGCCCLQMTFQASNIDEARRLYDHLAPLAPIMLALTAASPAHRGYLTDIDCRWNIISSSVDDRTPAERGLAGKGSSKFVINKSRYDSIDSYISNDSSFKDKYNDLPLVVDNDILQTLKENGVDDLLAQHIAHLFIRDPLVVFKELLDQDNETSRDHFENIQSTNWQTLRFKPPPNDSMGWRVEFRSMEVQLTDFQNAAFVVFIVLLTRTILTFHLNFYIPITKVDKNMEQSQIRDAARSGFFYFRKNVFDDDDDSAELMSMNEIFNGKGCFPGLIPLIEKYLESLELDLETRCRFSQYLSHVKARASGQLLTTAAWMRQFIQNHPKYQNDSVVSEEINFDLLKACDQIARGELRPVGLLQKLNCK